MDPRTDDAGLLAADAMQRIGFAIINVLGVLILVVPVVFSVFVIADVVRGNRKDRERTRVPGPDPVDRQPDESAA